MTPTHFGTDAAQSSLVRAWATWIDDMFRIARDVSDAQRRFTVTLLGTAGPVVDAAPQAGQQPVAQAHRVVSTTADVASAPGTVDGTEGDNTDVDDTGAEDQVADLVEVLDDVTEDLEVDTDLTAVVIVDAEIEVADDEGDRRAPVDGSGAEDQTIGGQGEAGTAQDVAERAAHRVEEHQASDGGGVTADSTDSTGPEPSAREETAPARPAGTRKKPPVRGANGASRAEDASARPRSSSARTGQRAADKQQRRRRSEG